MKTYSKSNHRRCSIKKVSLNISRNLQENTCVKASFLLKLHEAFIEKETLAQVFFCEFCDIFKNPFLTENLRVTASDLRMQVVIICNLNLSLIFVTLHFHFCEFSRWHILQSRLNFCMDMFFSRVILNHALQDRF